MFKFLNREKTRTLVLMPGWAFDCGIFRCLDLPYNYLLFCGEDLTAFEPGLKNSLRKRGMGKISLFGWSQGAFLACNFADGNRDLVDELILVGLKKRCERRILENVKICVERNRKAYLSKFYRDCFSEEEAREFSWFKARFLRDYLENMAKEHLLRHLDWLANAQMDTKPLRKLKSVKIVHGVSDRIAPVEEAVSVAGELPQASLILMRDAGHLPFLRSDFKRYLHEERGNNKELLKVRQALR